MGNQKAQSSVEFLMQYSWAVVLLVLTISAVVAIGLVQHQIATTSSYCYISPELDCYQTTFVENAMGSGITTLFTNLQSTPVIITGYAVSPAAGSTYASGSCNATVLLPGQSAQCSTFISGFTPTEGSKVNPVFNIQYKECSGTCTQKTETKPLQIEGSAVVSAPSQLGPSTPLFSTSSTSTSTVSTTSTASTTTTGGGGGTTTPTTSIQAPSTSSTSTTSSSTTTSICVSCTTTTSTSTSTSSTSSTTSTSTSSTSTTIMGVTYYTVSISESPSAAAAGWDACVGTSSSSQICAGTTNPASGQVAAGSVLTYLCTAPNRGNAGYAFSSWSGAVSSSNGCPGSNGISVTVNSNVNVVANYVGEDLTASSPTSSNYNPNTGQTFTLSSDISCSGACSGSYTYNWFVSGQPVSGCSGSSSCSTYENSPGAYGFSYFVRDLSYGGSSTSGSTTVNVQSTTTSITYYTVTLQISPTAAAGGYFACFTTSASSQVCAGQGQSGTSVSVSVPAGTTITDACYSGSGSDYAFTGWSGAFSSSTACLDPGTVVNGNLNIVANYQLPSYTITVQINPSSVDGDWGACFTTSNSSQVCAGDGTDTASATVPAGTQITDICTGDWNGGTYSFSGWSGVISSSNPCFDPGTIVTNSGTLTASYSCSASPGSYQVFSQSSCYGGVSDSGSYSPSGGSSITGVSISADAGSGADQNGYTQGGASTDVTLNGNDYGSSCSNDYSGDTGSSTCSSDLTWSSGTVTTNVNGDSNGNRGATTGGVSLGSSVSVGADANPGDIGGSCSASASIYASVSYTGVCS